MKKYIIAALFSLVVLGGLAFYQYNYFNDGKLHVTFCNVGQGDGIVIRTPDGKNILVDGGPDNSILTCLAKNMPFWDRTIDLVILSHPDLDHYYGLIDVTQRYTVKMFATQPKLIEKEGYNQLQQSLAEKHIPIRSVCNGDTIRLPDQVSLQIVWPHSCTNETSIEATETNNLSVVALLTYGTFDLLLTGDIDETITEEIGPLAGDISVLKVPHHGSKSGFDEEFLLEITPELAVISVGKKNRYGHPAKSIIAMLNEHKIKMLRTDQQGDIRLVSDGKTFWVKNN